MSVLRQAKEAETIALGPNSVHFLLGGEETGGQYSLTRFVMAPPPAAGPPQHLHREADELLYVLEGALDCTIAEQSRRLSAGDVMYVPRGTWHGIANPGPGTTTLLVVLTPPGFEGYWRDSAQLLAASGGLPGAEAMAALQQHYHMETGGQARQFR